MKRLIAAFGIVSAVVALWVTAVATQSIDCGGSFLPSQNCTISGRWNFTNTRSSTNTTTQGPIPFQVGGTDVTGIVSRVTDISNAGVLALDGTPVAVVPAPGAGYFVDVIAVQLILNYTATYTGGGDLRLYYGSRTTGNAASATITASGLLTSVTADAINRVDGVPDNTDPPTTNLAVVLQRTTTGNFGGGHAANILRVVVHYRIVRTGL